MGKTYLGYEPKQKFLLPPSPEEWLPADHLAYFVQDVVGELELGEIHGYYERERRGAPPYHPEMMVGLLLYAYCVGVPSSRKIERKTYEDVAFRVLAAGNHPDHTRLAEFRRIHSKALAKLFKQVLKLCIEAGLVKLGHVALDGTKLKANASKHKAMSYGRMKEKEAELEKKVAELLMAAERADAEDDARLGRGKKEENLPPELRDAQTRLEKIRAAKAALEAEARAAAEEEKEEAAKEEAAKEEAAKEEAAKEEAAKEEAAKEEAAKEDAAKEEAAKEEAAKEEAAKEEAAKEEAAKEEAAKEEAAKEEAAKEEAAKEEAAKEEAAKEEAAKEEAAKEEAAKEEAAKEEAAKEEAAKEEAAREVRVELPSHCVPHTAEGVPTDKAQRNFTDAESRIQKTNDGFIQGFNGQAAVDAESQVIIAQALTNQSPDVQHLAPMVDLIKENCGMLPTKLSADSGYFSEQNVARLELEGIDGYLAVGREKHGEKPKPARGRPPSNLTVKQRMARKLSTQAGRAVYARRKAIVEPVFGQIKGARGFRQLLRRGLEAARDEWALICATHNLLKLHRFVVA
jgi:transposase